MILVSKDPCQVGGLACRAKLSGAPCHGDPEDDGGYYIVGGSTRFIQNSLDMRTNYPHVFAYKKETIERDNFTRVECDYRASFDRTGKTGIAFHLFLTVGNKAAHEHTRDHLKRTAHMATMDMPPLTSSTYTSPASFDMFNFIPAMPVGANKTQHTFDRPGAFFSSIAHSSTIPSINVGLQNISVININLVAFFFLLGANTRAEMMKLVCPFLATVWDNDDEEEEEEVDDGETDTTRARERFNVVESTLSSGKFDGNQLAIARTCYALIYMQPLVQHMHSIDTNEFSAMTQWARANYPMPPHHQPNEETSPPRTEEEEEEDDDDDKEDDRDYNDGSDQPRVDGWTRHVLLGYITKLMYDDKKTSAAIAAAAATGTSAASATRATAKKGATAAAAPSPVAGTTATNAIAIETVDSVVIGDAVEVQRQRASNRVALNPALAHAVPAARKSQIRQYSERPWQHSFERVKKSIFSENMPCVGVDNSFRTRSVKLRMLGAIILKMIVFHLELAPQENIDDMNMKRITMGGQVKAELLRMSLQSGLAALKDDISQQCEEGKTFSFKAMAEKHFHKTYMDTTQHVMATGKWPRTTSTIELDGVSQLLTYASPASRVEQLRKVTNTNLHPQSKTEAAHQLRPDSKGILCTHHTPSDIRAGLSTYLAQGMQRRHGYENAELSALILPCKRHGIIPVLDVASLLSGGGGGGGSSHSSRRHRHQHRRRLHDEIIANCVQVYINDELVGYTRDPHRTCTELRRTRAESSGAIPIDVSITWVGGPAYHGGPLALPYSNSVRICGDSGGQVRPVYRLSELWRLPKLAALHGHNSALLHRELIHQGVVQYVDVEEGASLRIASSIYAVDEEENEDHGRKREFLDDDGNVRPNDDPVDAAAASLNDASREDIEARVRARVECAERMLFIPGFQAAREARQLAARKRYIPQSSTTTTTTMNYSLSDHIAFTESMGMAFRHSVYARGFFTHAEVTGEFLTGVISGTIPHINHSDANRGVFGSAMKEQLIGVRPLDAEYRKKNYAFTMMIPRKTLAPTLANPVLSMGGSVGMVERLIALKSHPLDAEDGTAQRRCDHGQSTFIQRVVTSSAIKPTSIANGGVKDKEPTAFEKPDVDTCLGLRSEYYDAIGEDGMPMIGAVVDVDEALIGKTFTAKIGDAIVKRDKSDVNHAKVPQVVVGVISTSNANGGSLVHVITEAARGSEIANKGTTHPGQKGVINGIVEQVDMDYIMDGGRAVSVDVIMNPHAMPSRTTVGQHVESQQSHIVLGVTGRIDPVDQWDALDMADQMELLKRSGMNYTGESLIYDGVTGEPTQAHIFRGYLDYAFLHHLAHEKFKSRNTGGVDAVTKQPAGGKLAGNIDGTMEVSNKNGQGGSFVVNESLNTTSDPTKIVVCANCGIFATPHRRYLSGSFLSASSQQRQQQQPSSSSSHMGGVEEAAATTAEKDRREKATRRQDELLTSVITRGVGGTCGACGEWQSLRQVDLTMTMVVTTSEVNAEGIAWRLRLSEPSNQRLMMSEHQMADTIIGKRIAKLAVDRQMAAAAVAYDPEEPSYYLPPSDLATAGGGGGGGGGYDPFDDMMRPGGGHQWET